MTELQRQMARYLRQRGAAVAARELAERFLRLECDEEIGRRLLAPVLEELPGVRYEAGSGWRIGESVPAAPALWWDDFISVAAAPAAVAGDRPAGGARIAWVRLSGGRAVESGGAEAASGPPPSLPIVAAGPPAEIATLRAWLSERPGAGPLLPISRLERAVGRPVRRLRLDEEPAGELDLAERARSAGRRLLGLAPELEAAGLGSLDRAAEALRRRPGTDFSRFEFGPSFLRALPPVPGVYRFVDAAGRTFYVGKTRNLRSRVRSYFRPSVQRAARVRRLLANLARVEFEPRGSEADALVDEQDAIRRGRPAGNRQMRICEGQASALGTGRWAVVAPSASGGAECSLFFLVEGRLASRLRRMTAGRARRIERALVRTERVPASQRAREAGEQLRRWVAARPREFSVLRLDEPPGTGAALKLIVRLLRHYEVERGKVEVR